MTQTVGEIADRFKGDARDAIISDGRLAAFIEKAKTREYYRGKN